MCQATLVVDLPEPSRLALGDALDGLAHPSVGRPWEICPLPAQSGTLVITGHAGAKRGPGYVAWDYGDHRVDPWHAIRGCQRHLSPLRHPPKADGLPTKPRLGGQPTSGPFNPFKGQRFEAGREALDLRSAAVVG